MLEADAGSYAGEVDIAAPRERVLAALTTLDGLEGWWTPEVTGSPAAGGELTFTFDDRRQDISMRVERADSGSVVWTCLGYPKFPEWAGTTLAFELRGEGDTTHLEFHHFGLTPTCDCYGLCSRGWDHYLASIKAYVETGTGNPWGSDEWAARRDERLAAR
jgi:uncharacterized protein YndB with AHSA1/START domain